MKENKLLNYRKELEKRLEEEKARQLNHQQLIEEGSVKDGTIELSSYDNHPADLATQTFDLQREFALKQHQKNIIKDIEDAIDRIDQGDYGTCEFCGTDIGSERLEIIPTARLCIKCEEERKIDVQDLEKDAPVEEDILAMPFTRTFNDFDDDSDNTGYDGEDAWQEVQRYGSSSGPQDISVNKLIDYSNDYYDSDEDVGYVEEVEKISNEQYKEQLPYSHGNSFEGYVETHGKDNEDTEVD